MSAVTDKGYFSGREILACHEAGITTTLPRPETSGNRKKGMYVKADFAYDADADIYRCPAGEALTYRYKTEENGLVVRRYWTNACLSCAIKARCTTGRERRISRWEHEHLVDEMRDRMNRDPALMKLRRSTVEHPFGTIKAWMGATHFRMRTLKKCPYRDGIPCPRLQHQAHDQPDRCTWDFWRHSCLNRAYSSDYPPINAKESDLRAPPALRAQIVGRETKLAEEASGKLEAKTKSEFPHSLGPLQTSIRSAVSASRADSGRSLRHAWRSTLRTWRPWQKADEA